MRNRICSIEYMNSLMKLNLLCDVDAPPSDNDMLQWDEASGLWLTTPNPTAPADGIFGHWTRDSGTATITSAILNDHLTLTGNLTLPTDGTISAGTADFGPDLITLNGTLGEVTVDGDVIAKNFEIPITTELVGQIIQDNSRLVHTYGAFNLFVGKNSGNFDTTGLGSNVGVGENTLTLLEDGTNNMAIGLNAGSSITSGSNNTPIGNNAGRNIDTGINNMLFGRNAGLSITSGGNNVAIGNAALDALVTGSSNVAIGSSTFGKLTGTQNVGIGANVGISLVNDNFNTMIGYLSGFLSTGSSNVFIGHSSGRNQTSLGNLLIIDNQNRSSIANEVINSMLYGVFNASPALQTLNINAVTNVTQKLRIGDTTAPTYDLEVAGVVKSESGRIRKGTLIDDTDSPYTVLESDHVISVDTDTADVIVNLPAGVDMTNYVIKNIGSSGNQVIINPDGAELLIGLNTSINIDDIEDIDVDYVATKGWW